MRSKFKWIFTLLVALTMQFSFAQEKTVTGVVTDELGPVAGANVVVRGTSKGTTTDFDGNYSIKAKKGDVIEVSYVGTKEEVTVGDSNIINVTLKTVQLEAVEVVGALGIKRKADEVTSTYQVVSSKELNSASNPNAIQALVGKVSGVQISTTSNGANPTTTIRIRGTRSMTGNNQALVVIDGAISTASVLSALPPEMIDSMNILKGAQGAALYGKDGSNGVIMVTTKKGSDTESKFTVQVNNAIDFQEISFLPVRQTRYGAGWDGEYYSYENGGWGPEFDGSMVPVGFPDEDGNYVTVPYSSLGSDNIKDFYQTGAIYQNGVTLSASDSDSYVTFSANSLKNEFVVPGDQNNRKTFFLNAGKKVGKISVDANVNYITTHTETMNADGNALYYLLQAPTNVPISLFDNGSGNGWSKYIVNPYWQRDNLRDDSRADTFNGVIKLGYKFNDHISLNYNNSVRFSQNNYTTRQAAFNDAFNYIYDMSTSSYFSTYNSNARKIYSDLLLNFDYDLSDDFSFKANIGNNIQDYYTQTTSVGGSNLEIVGLYNISNVTSLVGVDDNTYNSYSRERSYSFFGNLDLGYKDFLFLNVTGRNDNYSILSKDNNSFFYPSVGLSFIPTKAFPSLKGRVLNNAKITANWTKVGQTGNVSAYAINNGYSVASGYPYGDLTSYVSGTTIYDSNISPEFFTTKEVGVNLDFFNSRLTLDGSFYITNTKDLITAVSSSTASGANYAYVNIGEMENKGFEIDLGFTPIKTKDFRWENKASFSTTKTKVLKVSDQTNSLALLSSSTGMGGWGIYAEEGEEFPIIKGHAYVRDDEGHVIIDPTTGTPEVTEDLVKIGKSTPDYIIGYNTNFYYKNWRLGAVFDYRGGYQVLSQTKETLAIFGYLVESAEGGRTGFVFPNSVYLDSSTGQYVENTSVLTGGTTYSSYQQYYANEYTNVAENFIVDATALKVREISLAYSLDEKLLDRTGIKAVTLGVNLRNPFTFFPKSNRGYTDPESSYSTGNAFGYSPVGNYPQTRTYGFSVNLTF